ncbi:erythromycin esterase family protein [Algoriphagus limi]|uniref:Erythromycin esterase family protein n=1 Tax=Algoriphagus limi TaxID=2975273 RepID=A0ABT2G6K7_9BACT|nr:erythromycin esterase family protein [Algoriphagus limi]MCS5490894.1 erythromycin esterase family protein [Algoriphagus limi]
MSRKFIWATIFLFCLLASRLQAQDEAVIDWINQYAIEIESADPDSQPLNFHKKVPRKFSEAQVFGFGEATHQGKEFFNLKAQFFKYLVENQGVRAFLLEDSYPAEAGINEWISGGRGDATTIEQEFSIGAWHAKEVVNLLEWIRNYNIQKPKEEQIRFFGIDIQSVEGINTEIRRFVENNKLPIREELLLAADSCAKPQFMYQRPAANWASSQIPKLKEIEKGIVDAKSTFNPSQLQESYQILRALNSLISYIEFVQNPVSTVRDKGMFENTRRILEYEIPNKKAFIWAHNNHINNLEIPPYGSNWINLGAHLKSYYQDRYYSVGFDFGSGTLPGYVAKKNEWELFSISKPFKDTYAKTLIQAAYDIYFVDMEEALRSEAAPFFKSRKKQFITGGPGFTSKKRSLIEANFSEMYDGLIFLKKVSPTYSFSNLTQVKSIRE